MLRQHLILHHLYGVGSLEDGALFFGDSLVYLFKWILFCSRFNGGGIKRHFFLIFILWKVTTQLTIEFTGIMGVKGRGFFLNGFVKRIQL